MARRITSDGDLIFDVESGDESTEAFRSLRYGDAYVGTDNGDFVVRTGRQERGRIKADGTASGVFISSGAVAKIASVDATSTEKARADYVCDGVDDHVQWHQAMADIGTNGGKVEPFGGNFNGGQVIVKNRIWVDGEGKRATTYKLKAGVNADAFINYVSQDGVEANAEFVKISHLCIDANKSQQTAGNGIFFTANPSGTKATNDTDFDPHNEVECVEILNAFQDGFAATSRSETRLINVYSELAGRYAFNPSFDTFIVACTAAHAGLAGFFCQSSSIRAVGCKAFYSGQVTPGLGRGLWIKSTHGIVFEGFEAQDNNDAGILFDGAVGCRVSGSCDSNSTRGVGLAPAVDFFGGANNNVVDVACLERDADGTHSYQQNAVRFRSTCTGNDVRLSHTAWGAASIGAALMPGSDATTGNRVFSNGVAV